MKGVDKVLAYARKENIDAVRFMRVAAMLLVVLIHTTGVGLSHTSPESPFYAYYLFLNRFTRFEGAVFVFLSGLVLFYTYEARPFSKEVWKTFYKKRFLYILMPFLVWSIFYEWFAWAVDGRTFEGFWPFVERIITGQSYYQLYFILILVQFYFLLPVFMFFYHKVPLFKKYMVPIGFVVELVMALLTKHFEWQFAFPLFTVYIASFLLGGWVAIHYQQLKNIWRNPKMGIAVLVAAILGLLYTYGFYLRNVLVTEEIGYFSFKALNIFYFLIACFVLFKGSLWLVAYGGKILNTTAERLRIYSFGFYLVHPFILNLLERWIQAQTEWQFHLLIWLRYILVVLGCYVFIRVIHLTFPKVWMLFGNLPKPRK